MPHTHRTGNIVTMVREIDRIASVLVRITDPEHPLTDLTNLALYTGTTSEKDPVLHALHSRLLAMTGWCLSVAGRRR